MTSRDWSRRAALGGVLLGGLGLSGCGRSDARSPERADPSTSTSTREGADQPNSTDRAARETSSPTGSANSLATEPVISREEIVARFSGRTPTQWSNGESFRGPIDGLVRRTDSDKVVLTLDACGGPHGSGIDTRIIDLLTRHQIPAVLFLNQRWVDANPATFEQFAATPDLFEIGNHGTRHCPLSVTGRTAYKEQGTLDVGEVYDEVMGNHLSLAAKLGRAPVFYRSGMAYYDEIAIEIVRALGEYPIGFDINGDAGTTYSAAQVDSETSKAKPGSIIICHMNQPTRPVYDGLALALPRMLDKGIQFSKLTGLPMVS